MASAGDLRQEAIPGCQLPGPFPVGVYAGRLRGRLRGFQHVQLVGELCGFSPRRARVYFELRDGDGALPCSMWRDDFDRLGLEVSDGLRVVVGGGCDFYPGSAHSSPGFSFSVSELRVAGEGDLILALERLRRVLRAEGLFERQQALPRLRLPRTIGVVTGRAGKAGDDVRAALLRRGWAGRLIWAFAPVQDRHAAPMISAALRDLASLEEVDVVILARGGGSLADLLAFCDESLCRTVALLRVPVIASIGHHTDRTLIDDVAAVSCSTPTHAAEAAVPLDLVAARRDLRAAAARLDVRGRAAVVDRARVLGHLSRAPRLHVERQRVRLHQLLRELRAGARRGLARGEERLQLEGRALEAARARGAGAGRAARARELERLRMALAAHDPERTLARGYALVEDAEGQPVASAAAAAGHDELALRFHDGRLPVRVVRR
jgi:exodeoxyribonuclease VII large subunit